MRTVLFVCTGNIFRSMTAEYAFRAQVGDALFRAASAGVEATVQEMYGPVKDRLVELGIDPSGHVQRKLTREMLDAVDLAVAMGMDHQVFVREHFDREVVLFNRVALGTDEPIPDIWEAVPDWRTSEEGAVYICTLRGGYDLAGDAGVYSESAGVCGVKPDGDEMRLF